MKTCSRSAKKCEVEDALQGAVKIRFIDVTAKTIVRSKKEWHCQRAWQAKLTPGPMYRFGYPVGPPSSSRVIDDSPFPFFELPQEIRDQVYAYLVVHPNSGHGPAIKATTILRNRKQRIAAQAARERLNGRRLVNGKSPVCSRLAASEPLMHMDLLRASRRLHTEASDCLYSKNWFHISFSKLPSTEFDTPFGWDLSRVKKLELDLEIKDSLRMNRYIDWTTFFSALPSLRFLRITPRLHARYFEWAYPELSEWQTAHYIHKAFFRELLAAIPGYVDLRIGSSMKDVQVRGSSESMRIKANLLYDMYADLGSRKDRGGKLLPVAMVVNCDH